MLPCQLAKIKCYILFQFLIILFQVFIANIIYLQIIIIIIFAFLHLNVSVDPLGVLWSQFETPGPWSTHAGMIFS